MPLHERANHGRAAQERLQGSLPVGHDPQQGIGQSHRRPTNPDHDYRNFIGLLPLLFGAGQTGKEILYPLALVVFGGMFTSTILDQVVTPALFFKFGRKIYELSPTDTPPASVDIQQDVGMAALQPMQATTASEPKPIDTSSLVTPSTGPASAAPTMSY